MRSIPSTLSGQGNFPLWEGGGGVSIISGTTHLVCAITPNLICDSKNDLQHIEVASVQVN